MMKIVLIMFLTASVASVVIQNGLGTCLSFAKQTTGQFVMTVKCDPSDKNQINWVVNQLNISSIGQAVQFCINQTNYCVGIQKNQGGLYDNINLKLVSNDTTDSTQQWIPLNSQFMVNHYVNGKTGGCAQAYSAFGRGGVINTVNCRNIKPQQWTIISS